MLLSKKEEAHGRISMATYYCYFKAGGNLILLIILLALFILAEVSCSSFLCIALLLCRKEMDLCNLSASVKL